jgi:hypothetical protein
VCEPIPATICTRHIGCTVPSIKDQRPKHVSINATTVNREPSRRRQVLPLYKEKGQALSYKQISFPTRPPLCCFFVVCRIVCAVCYTAHQSIGGRTQSPAVCSRLVVSSIDRTHSRGCHPFSHLRSAFIRHSHHPDRTPSPPSTGVPRVCPASRESARCDRRYSLTHSFISKSTAAYTTHRL